jgi:hypothetical protein
MKYPASSADKLDCKLDDSALFVTGKTPNYPAATSLSDLIMKRDLHPVKKPAAPSKRPIPTTPGHSTPTQARRRNENKGPWRPLIIGVLVIGGVFVGLEVSRQAPRAPAVAAAEKTTPEIANSAETIAPPQAEEQIIPETAEVLPEAIIPAPPTQPTAPSPQKSVLADEAILLGKESCLILTDLDSRRENAILRDKDLFRRAIEGKAWNAYRELLAKSIESSLERARVLQGISTLAGAWLLVGGRDFRTCHRQLLRRDAHLAL